MILTPLQKKVTIELLNLFKIGGKKGSEMVTEGQFEIFYCLVFQPHNRVQILTSTQYGKSLTVALACIIISCIQKEVIAVVAPTNDKAKIIMRYYIEHLGDHPLFFSQLEKNSRLDRLRMEESKDRIILRNGGGIYVISVQAGNSKKGVEAAMGAGARKVIQDESGLIPDSIEATIYRMIAGKGEDAIYVKIGNPFYRNHFLKSWKDPKYHKIFIDYHQAIKEKRYTQEFIDEARSKPLFDILYECKFPKPDALDISGFSVLYTEDFIRSRIRQKVHHFGQLKLLCDVAGEGKNFSTIVLQSDSAAEVIYKEHNPDIMNFTYVIAEYAKQYKLIGDLSKHIKVDRTGIGQGVYFRLKELPETKNVVGVQGGEAAEQVESFINCRAEMFWRQKDWLNKAELKGTFDDWADMCEIRYKIQSDRKVKIKSKIEMLKDGVSSPDVPDALSLGFYRLDRPKVKQQEREHIQESKYEGTMSARSESIISEQDLAKM